MTEPLSGNFALGAKCPADEQQSDGRNPTSHDPGEDAFPFHLHIAELPCDTRHDNGHTSGASHRLKRRTSSHTNGESFKQTEQKSRCAGNYCVNFCRDRQIGCREDSRNQANQRSERKCWHTRGRKQDTANPSQRHGA